MNNNEKNIVDKFLDKYDQLESKKKVDVKTYYRPPVGKCIIGFIFCLVFFIILLGLFNFSMVYLVVFFGNLFGLVYFGLNLFSKKGFVLTMKHRVSKEYIDELNKSIDDEMDKIEYKE